MYDNPVLQLKLDKHTERLSYLVDGAFECAQDERPRDERVRDDCSPAMRQREICRMFAVVNDPSLYDFFAFRL